MSVATAARNTPAKPWAQAKNLCRVTNWQQKLTPIGVNRDHALKRSNADKRRCVEIALKEFGGMSDRAIAEMCGVTQPFVGKIRCQVITVMTSPAPTHRIGKDGKSYPVKPTVNESLMVQQEPEREVETKRTGLDGKTRKMSAGTGRFCFVTVSDGSQTFGRKLRGAGIHRKYEP